VIDYILYLTGRITVNFAEKSPKRGLWFLSFCTNSKFVPKNILNKKNKRISSAKCDWCKDRYLFLAAALVSCLIPVPGTGTVLELQQKFCRKSDNCAKISKHHLCENCELSCINFYRLFFKLAIDEENICIYGTFTQKALKMADSKMATLPLYWQKKRPPVLLSKYLAVCQANWRGQSDAPAHAGGQLLQAQAQ